MLTAPVMPELRVVFAPAEAGYRAALTDVDGRALGVEVPFTPFLGDDDYESLRWYLEDYMDLPDGGAVVRARAVEAQLAEWGRRLGDALFAPPENRALLDALRDGPEPRELTIATHVSALLRLPWEIMADETGNLAQRVSVRRQLRDSGPTTPREPALPLRLLYVVSRPSDAGFIDPRMTTQALLGALDPLGGSVRIDFCRPPTLARLEEMLRDAAGDPYDVLHFDGHGTFMQEGEIGALYFEATDDGAGEAKGDLVRADRLGDLLAQHRIPLVVLEACRSATIGRTDVFRAVAPRLIRAGVGSVLSMGHAVHVEAATVLLDRFYRELVRGTTIGHAVAQGRSALRTKPARWIEYGPRGRTITLRDWFLPHLYQRGADEPLFPRAAAAPQPVRQYDVFLSHTHADSARVERLARTLDGNHGLVVWLDKWETTMGRLEPQCERGIANSRVTVVAGSQRAVDSKWVAWEIDAHHRLNPEGDRLLPIKLEAFSLPPDLDALFWVDFTDPARDSEGAALVARHIRLADAEDARRRRGFRPPAQRGEPAAFPPPPPYGFQGRARELHDLERRFRKFRGIVLHAMGGMGKTTLATEAARWWTRTGLFRDGACFVSFEQFVDADRVVQLLGGYLVGPQFDQLPAGEQRRRAVELFREREVLLVWDNYESVLPQFDDGAAAAGGAYTDAVRGGLADLFEELTSDERGKGRVLVTCRPGETRLPDAYRMELHGLARADSLWLLHRILERHGGSLDDPRLARERLDPLLGDLADHPLSLELVGPHLRRLTPEVIQADFASLLREFEQQATEGRNRSLLASLEFSRRHLSVEAQDALPWLGLFSGGVFEDNLLDVSQIDPTTWDAIRDELEGIALLRVEYDIQVGGRPFLRFHPTLAIASANAALADDSAMRKRFVGVYYALARVLDRSFFGEQPRGALEVMSREEANYRTAVQWAVQGRQLQIVAKLGNTFSQYLGVSNHLRERDVWIQWIRDSVTGSDYTEEAVVYERQYAQTLLAQGDPRGAVVRLQALVERLRRTTEFDVAFQLAMTIWTLGRALLLSGAATHAIPPLSEAIRHWEALVEKESGQAWKALLVSADRTRASSELGNLSGSMGDLANAMRDVGQYTDALAMSEAALTIDRAMGAHRHVAAAHGQSAHILLELGRYDEADARYDLALAAARRAGDAGLEGTTFQHQGALASQRNQLDRATHLYQQALRRFQAAKDDGAVMRTYSLLGTIEQEARRLPAARAWYEKSRELAASLNDQPGLAQAAHNIGVVWQEEGQDARKQGDEPTARRHFDEARRSLEESLRIKRALDDEPGEGNARSQLAIVYHLLGDLASAERYAHESRAIREGLGLVEAFRDYNTLSAIAQTRGNIATAAEWAAKRDALLKELKRRSGGTSLPPQVLKPLQALTIACAQAALNRAALGPAEEQALAQLNQLPAPFPDFTALLRQLAAGQPPAIPSTLPNELQQLLRDVVRALREARAE